MEDAKYKKKPHTTTINPYKDNASLFKTVPRPTTIAPKMRRAMPTRIGPGTLLFFFFLINVLNEILFICIFFNHE